MQCTLVALHGEAAKERVADQLRPRSLKNARFSTPYRLAPYNDSTSRNEECDTFKNLATNG